MWNAHSAGAPKPQGGQAPPVAKPRTSVLQKPTPKPRSTVKSKSQGPSYSSENFKFLKVLGKGSFGKVKHIHVMKIVLLCFFLSTFFLCHVCLYLYVEIPAKERSDEFQLQLLLVFFHM